MEKFEDVLGKKEGLSYQGDDIPEVPTGGTCELVVEEKLPDNHAERITITEDDKDIIEKWYVTARSEYMRNHFELTEFLKVLMTNYNHDYGTVIHAMTAGAIAAIHVMNSDEFQGGITGFQASCMMWEFMKRFNYLDGPMRLLRFEHMLYPQYEYNFDKTISKETWEWLQNEAKERILSCDAADKVYDHWQTIIDGKVPFGYKIKEDE
jgi:hypothetical protein